MYAIITKVTALRLIGQENHNFLCFVKKENRNIIYKVASPAPVPIFFCLWIFLSKITVWYLELELADNLFLCLCTKFDELSCIWHLNFFFAIVLICIV